MENITLKDKSLENNLVAFLTGRNVIECVEVENIRMEIQKGKSFYLLQMSKHVGDGIQRFGHQREKGHTNNLLCLYCREVTRNTEVRWKDSYEEMMDRAMEVHREYYSEEKAS